MKLRRRQPKCRAAEMNVCAPDTGGRPQKVSVFLEGESFLAAQGKLPLANVGRHLRRTNRRLASSNVAVVDADASSLAQRRLESCALARASAADALSISFPFGAGAAFGVGAGFAIATCARGAGGAAAGAGCAAGCAAGAACETARGGAAHATGAGRGGSGLASDGSGSFGGGAIATGCAGIMTGVDANGCAASLPHAGTAGDVVAAGVIAIGAIVCGVAPAACEPDGSTSRAVASRSESASPRATTAAVSPAAIPSPMSAAPHDNDRFGRKNARPLRDDGRRDFESRIGRRLALRQLRARRPMNRLRVGRDDDRKLMRLHRHVRRWHHRRRLRLRRDRLDGHRALRPKERVVLRIEAAPDEPLQRRRRDRLANRGRRALHGSRRRRRLRLRRHEQRPVFVVRDRALEHARRFRRAAQDLVGDARVDDLEVAGGERVDDFVSVLLAFGEGEHGFLRRCTSARCARREPRHAARGESRRGVKRPADSHLVGALRHSDQARRMWAPDGVRVRRSM